MPPEKARTRRKPSAVMKKTRKKGLPSPCMTPFLNLADNQPFEYVQDQFSKTASCIRFLMVDSAKEIPESSLDYLMSIVQTVTQHVHAVLHAPASLLFMSEVLLNEGLERLLRATNITVPGTNYKLLVSHDTIPKIIEECLSAMDTELGFENFPDDDFSMPSSSDEEPPPRKMAVPRPATTAVAKHALPAVQPTPPTRTLQAAIPLPAPAAKPPTAAAPSASTVDPVLPPVVPAGETPESSLRSAPSSQPAPSTPVTVTQLVVATTSSTTPAEADATAQPESRRRRFRYKAVDFDALVVSVPATPAVLTVLIRPTTAGDDFSKQNSKKLAVEIAGLGATATAVRDIRNGGLALDFPADTPTAPLLAMTSLLGLPVTCSVPADSQSLSAVVSGIHPEITEEDILADMTTFPPCKLLAVRRLARPGQQSWSVKITVAGPTLPERALLYGRSRRVATFHQKPLQCLQCGRYGHNIKGCRSSLRCWTCGQAHETATCQSRAEPRCGNCGGAHPADAEACPSRKLERKVCQVKAAHNTTFRTARVAVEKAARTYAAATKGPPGSRPPPLIQQPQLAGGFQPNIAHPRPLPAPGQSDHAHLAALFQGLLTILSAAAASSDFSGALVAVSRLFQSHAPGADAAAFAV